MTPKALACRLLETDPEDWDFDPTSPDESSDFVGLKRERWVFSGRELSSPYECKGTDAFIAYVYSEADDADEESESLLLGNVVVLRNGTVLDYSSTGQPVDAEMQRLADEVDTLVNMLDYSQIYQHWKDVFVDKDGAFLDFDTQSTPGNVF